jgi:hypothetical protein
MCLKHIAFGGVVRWFEVRGHKIAGLFDTYIAVPMPCRAAVFFPIDLHSTAVFDSHMPCRVHAASVPCQYHAILKATSQGHGTALHGHGMACVN